MLPANAAAFPVTPVSLLVASAVALTGLLFLASGLSRIASGSAGPKMKFGFFGSLGRFGRPDRVAGASHLRSAATAILLGGMLMSLPDYFDAGILSQVKTVMETPSSQPGPGAYRMEDRPDAKNTSRGGGAGSRSGDSEFSLPIPWWVFGLIGLILLFVLVLWFVGDTSGSPVKSVAGRPAAGRTGGGASMSGSSRGGSGAAGGATDPPDEGLIPYLFKLLERIGKRIQILIRGALLELRRLYDQSERTKSRLRPIAAFAAATTLALRDHDDGGSNLPAVREQIDERRALAEANGVAFLDRIVKALSLTGDVPVDVLSKHLKLPKKQVAADLFRLGSSGRPSHWLRVVSVDGEEWLLAEGSARSAECRFSGVLRFDDVDWNMTLSVDRRLANYGLVIVAKEGAPIHLVAARDARATRLASKLNDSEAPPADIEWCFVDLPIGYIRRHYGPESDHRWEHPEHSHNGEALVFLLGDKSVQIVSGADELDEGMSRNKGVVRALVGVMPKGALAQIDATAADVVPEDLNG